MRLIIICLAGIAGCSSSGGRGDRGDRLALAANLETALAVENISDPAALPFQGTANYTGYMTLGLPANGATQDRAGDLDLSVNFGASRNQVSGTASHFDGATGSLAISGGSLDRTADPDTDFTFGAQLDGTLQFGAEAYDIDGHLFGDFRGRDQGGVTGIVSGTMNGQDSQDIFDGTLAATRID